MIKHIVLLDLPATHDAGELLSIMHGLDALRDEIAGFTRFEHGPNRDFEGMSPDHAYGFICHFDNEDTSQSYLINPTHKALGARLVALCSSGVKGITVIDLDLSTDAIRT